MSTTPIKKDDFMNTKSNEESNDKRLTFLGILYEKIMNFVRCKRKGQDSRAHSIEWGYGETNGPLLWNKFYPFIKKLKRQSPININVHETVFNANLIGIEMKLSSNCCKIVRNVEFTIKATGDANDCFTSGGILKDRYCFDHFHMHWGPDNQTGSEHALDGEFYPAEIHIVFYNADKYADFKNASQSMSFDGLVIFCIFVKEGQTSATFSLLAEAAHNLTYKGDTYKLPEQFNVNNLLPGNRKHFFAYEGSLSTPPCYESCEWIIYKEPIEVSSDDISAFRHIHCTTVDKSSAKTLLSTNCRPLQALNSRTVYRSYQGIP